MAWVLAAGGGILASVSGAFYCNLLLALNRESDCLRLLLASTSFRLSILVLANSSGDTLWLRAALVGLAWPTLALEWWLVGNWLRKEV
jgi:hypothetical protein